MYLDLRWLIVIASASIIYGILSPLIAARRLYFLAASLPHIALLSAILAILASRVLSGSVEAWSIVISIALVYTVAFLISKGVDSDIATAVFVSLSVSLTVIGMYYVLTRFPAAVSLWAYVLGDPLLTTWRDTSYTVLILTVILILNVPFLREQVLIGIDRDFVKLSGRRVAIYDAMLMASLALATVGMLKVVGYVIEHVMLLLPGAIGATLAKSSRSAIVGGLASSLLGGILGLFLSLTTGLAPSGLIGLTLLLMYVLSLILKRWRS